MMRKILTLIDLIIGYIATIYYSGIARSFLMLYGAHLGNNFKVRGLLDLHFHSSTIVNIGDNCRIKSGFAENAVGGYRRTGIWVGRNGILNIGNNVGISNTTIVCMNTIIIEDDVFIGGDCNIYDSDFHSIDARARILRPDRTVKTAPVLIKRYSFIGAHSLILKGVVIGEASVIGAGSVVTQSVPSGEIWAGNPARFVRKVALLES